MRKFTSIFPMRLALMGLISFISCKNLSQVKNNENHGTANQLINESSPYLLQHAYNPVDWHPWGKKALDKAQKENKLLIISIGYAACHWCHVMEHESFEDSTVAAIMNEHFVPIKVDREERPDVDDVYMAAAQLVSGRGGWPLNAFALPDGRPVWAGTYFPKEQWTNILNQFAKLKNEDYERLESSAAQLTSGIKSLDQIVVNEADEEYSPDDLKALSDIFIKGVDEVNGGRTGAPKFPMPNNYEYLLKYGFTVGDQQAIESVTTTLDKMALGGIYDQVGGGFARYSVDDVWKVPHFEKMLYDNGQLISLYAQAYQLTKNQLYADVITQSLAFIERELSSPEGGFYSSLDADSDGEEGLFYIWSDDEINELITDPEEKAIYKAYFTITKDGNWEHQSNILHVTEDIDVLCQRFDVNREDLRHLIRKWNKVLLEARSEKVRPALDDKILTSWNALMIHGYVDAYRALKKPEYLKRALDNARFLIKNQQSKDFRLNRNYKNGKSSINAFLDDYAILIDAFVALYEVTFDQKWLTNARGLTDYVLGHFQNKENGLFNYTSDLDPPLVARKMELSDNVIPASNSIMARNLVKLGEFFYDKDYMQKGEQMLKNMLPSIKSGNQPSFYSNWLQLYLDFVYPPFEVAVIGEQAVEKAHEMMTHYTASASFLGDVKESDLPLLLNKFLEGETMIYVCQNKTCKLPVTDVGKALELIKYP